MAEINPVWEKQLDEKFTLLEFKNEPNTLHCTVHYVDEETELTFAFGSWGMERESISVEDCVLCCQMLLACDANVSISSFASNLEFARNELNDEEDEV
jgi:hypothetical protein